MILACWFRSSFGGQKRLENDLAKRVSSFRETAENAKKLKNLDNRRPDRHDDSFGL